MKQFTRISLSVFLALLLFSSHARGVLIVDPSFELNMIGTQIGGGAPFVFNATGQWTIDRGFIRGAENGITPIDGTQMLMFDASTGISTDIYQLIDVTPFASAIAAQQARADLSAFFNATAALDFQLTFLAFEENGLPINFNAFDDIFFEPFTTTSDADPATWEQLTLQYLIPSNTKFLAVGLSSSVSTIPSYADQVSLSITAVPEPLSITVWLLVAGYSLIRKRTSRRPNVTAG